ncbi:putative pentatricopeptide repeat-containing protein At5g47460 [Euphorbia lathyris]|uniref:putative pentatricopeptide repeat-containing protein At5g47460 n=1 Tax=Euphorbia lathyris TaxID=212925 RepID=UPI0033135C99
MQCNDRFVLENKAMQRPLLKKLQNQNHHAYKFLSQNISSDLSSLNNHVDQCSQNIESWSTIVSMLVHDGPNRELALYKASQSLNSPTKPDGYSLVHILRASTDLGFHSYCLQLHNFILKSGFVSNAFVSAALIRFYTIEGSINDAHKLFVEIPQPNVISWNTLISAYLRSGKFRKSLELFLQLDRSDTCSDSYSFTAALSACGQTSMLGFGKSIHCKIVKYGLDYSVIVGNCLIDMYGKCDSVEEAICVFDEMINKDIISWNSVIAASARNGRLESAYCFFSQLPEPDTISYNQMINGIAQFGNVEDAVMVLSRMPNPNSSSWNSIITAYVNRNQVEKALEYFVKMHSSNVESNEYTYSVLLSGVAGIAALKWGMLIHCCAIKGGFDTSVVVGSALIDMYFKCGQVKNAESIFQSLPRKNLVTWNAMISGYAHNGDLNNVIEHFEKLKMVEDLKPDWVTFLNVIVACSGSEVPLEKVIEYFESMVNDYGVEPTIEHCCSMVRLMGQKGQALEATKMIYELAFGSCGVVWRALLGACGTCRNLKVAKIAAAKVIQLEGDDDYVYVMMSNILASYGRWREVSKVRKIMHDRGMRKEVGCSWIEVQRTAP